ncbi:MAG TPA: GNAT family N-acetyltransferase [Thioploca sp.]|nr:GNAT family N-acetyltransferase [Thioploca sp.]
MNIRDYKPSDIEEISSLYYNTVHLVNAKDYSESQINAWAPSIYEKSFWARHFKKYRVFVAETDGMIIGFAEFELTGHIDCFYVHHNWQRKGIGTSLIKRIEVAAQNKHVEQLFADVSITAKPFFKRQGFTAVREQMIMYRSQNFEQFYMVKPGVKIVNCEL